MASQRDVKNQTTVKMNASLKSSEGCTESGPTPIQRRAPDTDRPTTKTEATRATAST